MINIKNKSLALFIMMLIISVVSCREDDGFNTVISEDKTNPDVVTNVKVDNFNGGAYITYDLPNSPNILYVLAKYHISDEVLRETKSSYYKDTIIVNGFAKEQEYNVTLYTVTRANVMSDSIIVKVNPQNLPTS